jgi:sugar phosphate permease
VSGPATRLGARVFYGWLVVLAAALVILAAGGPRSASGALLLAIEADTGWSISDIALAGAAGLLLLGLAGPLSGALIDRYGVRRVTFAALAVCSIGMALASAATAVWQLVLLFGAMTGLGAGLVSSSLGPIVANRWFSVRRGLVVGIFGAASSAGQLIFFPFLTQLAVTQGWRQAALVLAGILAVTAIPAVLLLRESPADVGQRPLGAPPGANVEVGRAEPGIMRRAARTPEFWLLCGTFFVCGATSNGVVGQHFIAHAVDHGFTQTAAASALALMGVFNFVGTIASGWLTDRFDPRKLLLVYYTFRGLSLLYLPAIHDQLDMVGFAILFGLDYIATVPPTVMLTADVFGRRNVGIVYGWIYAAHMIGAAILAWVAGIIRTHAGDYASAYIAAGFLAVMAGVVALTMRRRSPDLGVAAAAA